MFDIVIGRNQANRKKYGKEGTVLIGKQYVKMGQTTSLSNKVYLDVTDSHVVFICGKRGGGKCAEENTLITLNDGSEIPIKDLEKNDKDILALNQELKIKSTPKTEFFKREVNTLYEITLRSGKSIKLTPEHPLLLLNGWQPAKNIDIGARIATPRIKPIFGNKFIEEYKIKLLAYLIAEGSLSTNYIGFSNTDKELIDDFTKSINSFDDELQVKNENKNTFTVKKTKGKYNSLIQYIKSLNLMGKNSYTKFIPQCIFTSTKNNIALFLNRYFSCDGTIYYDTNKKSWAISCASSSETIIRQLQSLLLRFEIQTNIRAKLIKSNEKQFHSFEINIQQGCIAKFLQEIGFFGKKTKRIEKALNELPTINNPNLDTIPKEIWDKYRPENWANIGRQIGYKHPKSLRESIRYCPSRQKLQQIAILDNREDILKIAQSDIYWDEIIDIKELNGKFTVYDISVPEYHNFIANDILIHNSYTMGVIAEGVSDLPKNIKQNISIIILDTMGIYWTMKYPNHEDKELLEQWGLEPKGLDVKIYTPFGFYDEYKEKGIPTDYPFSMQASELSGSDWAMTFGVKTTDPLGVLVEKIIYELKEEKETFTINDIIKRLKEEKSTEQHVIDAAINEYMTAKQWGLFSEKGMPISRLAQGGSVSILDVSCYATQSRGWEIKSLVIGLVAQKLFVKRMLERKDEEFKEVKKETRFEDDNAKKQEFPLVWLIIDEAHEFMPVHGKTTATDPLVTILREGRQPGISLILATQQPGKIHTDVMTQSDTIISHRITAKLDTDALGMLMQSYMREGLDKQLTNLPRVKGAAIVLDDSNEKMYPMRVRPRFTWHGGSAPSAIHEKKKWF